MRVIFTPRHCSGDCACGAERARGVQWTEVVRPFPRSLRSRSKCSCITMSTVLIVAGLGVVGVVLAAAALWYRSRRRADLGSVSHTWVAELRAGEPYRFVAVSRFW